jgi:hypothetical protein
MTSISKKPATTKDTVYCVHCNNKVDTPEEVLSYPLGNCPDCGNSWTGAEKRDTMIVRDCS